MVKAFLLALCLACIAHPALAASRGYLGVWFGPLPITEKTVRAGVVLMKVFPGMAGEGAGLEPGEIVTAINGVPVPDPKSAVALLAENCAGDRIWLTVVHRTDGRLQQTNVFATMGSAPTSDFAKIMRARPLHPPHHLHSSSAAIRH
jgi:S1-C subfamily serine protease